MARLVGWLPAPRPDGFPRIILCYSPYVRYAELERAAASVDLALPEATAVETLPRHVAGFLNALAREDRSSRAASRKVDVISSDHALRSVLAEACSVAGFQARTASELDLSLGPRGGTGDAAPAGPDLTLWDVPVLEPDWPERLERRSRLGPVVAFLGFPDRTAVNLARTKGASACLEMPFDLADLIYVLDRVAAGRGPRSGDSGPVPVRTCPRRPATAAGRDGAPGAVPRSAGEDGSRRGQTARRNLE